MPDAHQTTLFTRTVRIAAAVALVVVVVLVAWKAVSALLLLFGAFLFATLLSGLAGFLARHTPLGYKVAYAVVGLVLLVLALGGIYTLGGTLAEQVAGVNMSVPQALDRLDALVVSWGSRLGMETTPSLRELLPSAGASMGRVMGIVGGVVGVLANVVIVLLVGAFFAAAPGTYRRGLLHLVPRHRRQRGGEALDAVVRAVRKWLIARLIAMTSTFVLTFIGLTIVGVPFTLGLAFIAGLAAFIPYIGAYIGGSVGVLVALSQGPQTALYAALVYVAIENGQGWTVEPLVESRMTAAPPALLLGAQVVLGTLLGAGGLILASPLVVVLAVLVQMLYVEDVLGDHVEVLGK